VNTPPPSRRYLLGELGWIRHQPFAAEAFDQLRAAGATIRRIVDSPPEQEIVGRCDCGTYLYARKGAPPPPAPPAPCAGTSTPHAKTCGTHSPATS
jgi:hypothetical protein